MIQKSGDIDLYIIPKDKENLTKKKIKFLAKLYEYIREKIDVVIAKDKNRLIEKVSLKNGREI